MDFPGSPLVGDEISVGSRGWRWNGTGWAAVQNAGQAVSVFVEAGPFVELNMDSLGNASIKSTGLTLLNYI